MVCFPSRASFFQNIRAPSLELQGGMSPTKVSSRAHRVEGPGQGPGASVPPSPHTSLSYSSVFCFCVESCFLFALTHQKLPPFCQQGYLRAQGLVGTESLRRHGVESGLLRDYTTADRRREDGARSPLGGSRTPGPPVRPPESNKEEL